MRTTWRLAALIVLMTGLAVAVHMLGMSYWMWAWLAIGPAILAWACFVLLADRPMLRF